MCGELLDHPLITARYFFPRAVPLRDPQFVACGDAQLACWHAPASAGQKTLVHFHGNGEVVADYLPDYARAIGDLGVGVFLAEYRGYGGSSGIPELGKMLGDVQSLYRALGLEQEQLVVYGRSVGALFAVEMASRYPRIAGLVLESGVADVLQRLQVRIDARELGVSDEALAAAVAARLDHRAKLRDYRGRLLVLHTRDDDLVTPEHARLHFDWATTPHKQLIWFDRGGHNGLLACNFPEYLDALRNFLNAL
ncbi:MAG: alpha/beta hydrolase [Planctomycetaceae bacterium]|nr:alpha/beta hydrolase [Planctomycetaceae bacterium]